MRDSRTAPLNVLSLGKIASVCLRCNGRARSPHRLTVARRSVVELHEERVDRRAGVERFVAELPLADHAAAAFEAAVSCAHEDRETDLTPDLERDRDREDDAVDAEVPSKAAGSLDIDRHRNLVSRFEPSFVVHLTTV